MNKNAKCLKSTIQKILPISTKTQKIPICIDTKNITYTYVLHMQAKLNLHAVVAIL